MAIDKNSNSFTFTFAIVMVVVVGSLLAFTYMQLKPAQQENVRREKMQNILAAMNVKVARDQAPELYAKLIKSVPVVDAAGREVKGVDTDPTEGAGFSLDVQKQFRDEKAGVITADQMQYPVYIAEQDGKPLYILPMVGTGLWGPVWGYVAVDDDGRTILGSTFDHKGETPGLGAEIATPIFTKQFPGKTFVDEAGKFTSIKVYKGGTQTQDPHGVDGISGGTITSDGVGEMLARTLAIYDTYLRSVVAASVPPAANEPIAEAVETIQPEVQ
jgi:Na+-transporting NADH:ubiquinone oxidoreductase subunit C